MKNENEKNYGLIVYTNKIRKTKKLIANGKKEEVIEELLKYDINYIIACIDITNINFIINFFLDEQYKINEKIDLIEPNKLLSLYKHKNYFKNLEFYNLIIQKVSENRDKFTPKQLFFIATIDNKLFHEIIDFKYLYERFINLYHDEVKELRNYNKSDIYYEIFIKDYNHSIDEYIVVSELIDCHERLHTLIKFLNFLEVKEKLFFDEKKDLMRAKPDDDIYNNFLNIPFYSALEKINRFLKLKKLI